MPVTNQECDYELELRRWVMDTMAAGGPGLAAEPTPDAAEDFIDLEVPEEPGGEAGASLAPPVPPEGPKAPPGTLGGSSHAHTDGPKGVPPTHASPRGGLESPPHASGVATRSSTRVGPLACVPTPPLPPHPCASFPSCLV
eukprot:jgi/Botrbrau1/6370/Bobra.0098s0029.1